MRKDLNVEVPATATTSRRTENHVIIEGEVSQGPSSTVGREVNIYVPHVVVERLFAARLADLPVIDIEEDLSTLEEPMKLPAGMILRRPIGKTYVPALLSPGSYTCEDCNWMWPLAGKPPAEAECDHCGGKLVKR